MKKLMVLIVALAFLGLAACAEYVDEPEMRSSVAALVVDADGNPVEIEIDFEPEIDLDVALEILQDATVVVSEFGLADDFPTDVNVDAIALPIDDSWSVPEDHEISVNLRPAGTLDFEVLDEYRWEWVELGELELFCPPGH